MEERFKTKQIINQIIAVVCYVSYGNAFLSLTEGRAVLQLPPFTISLLCCLSIQKGMNAYV